MKNFEKLKIHAGVNCEFCLPNCIDACMCVCLINLGLFLLISKWCHSGSGDSVDQAGRSAPSSSSKDDDGTSVGTIVKKRSVWYSNC